MEISRGQSTSGENAMLNRKVGQILALAIALTVVYSSVHAQTTVYKWVDEDGVVHFTDAPPNTSKPVDTMTLTTASPPANVDTPVQQVSQSTAISGAESEDQSTQPVSKMPPRVEKTDISKLSLAELDLRCEETREKMISPLREAEIAKCKEDKREDPAFCERFNADFGDGGRTASGSFRPRMFDDLPECVEAMQERNRRGPRR